jgi:hypothetical protein
MFPMIDGSGGREARGVMERRALSFECLVLNFELIPDSKNSTLKT